MPTSNSTGCLIGVLGLENGRNDLLRGRDLRDHGLEAREEQRTDVERALVVQPHDLLGDTTHEDVGQAGAAVGAHDDEVDVLLAGDAEDLLSGDTLGDVGMDGDAGQP